MDERSANFGFADRAAGFCGVLNRGQKMDLRQRTQRQYAAVLANLCARASASSRRSGAAFGLGAEAVFRACSRSTTVGDWALATETELAHLSGASLKDKAVRAAYRRIFGEAWAIGHGVGLARACPLPPETVEAEDLSVLAALGPDAEDFDAALTPVAMPNPFHGSTRLAFTIADAAGADVEMGVFDVAGRRVASLARGRLGAGAHVVQWDGRGLDGARARAGIYFVRGRIGQAEISTSVMKVE